VVLNYALGSAQDWWPEDGMTDWDSILWSALNSVLVVEGGGLVVGEWLRLVVGEWLRLAESGRQGVHRPVEPHPRSRLVDLVRHLKSSGGNRSTKIHDLRIGVCPFVPNRCLTCQGVFVCVGHWSHRGAGIPVLPGQVHASRMVYRGVYRTSGNRRPVHQLLSILSCDFFLVGLHGSFDLLLGAGVNVCQVNRNALSNRR